MYNFEFKQPTTISDAVNLLKSDEAQALGGGQTLIPTMKQRLASPSTLVSLTEISEMKGICKNDDGSISIGGGTTHAEVASHADIFAGLKISVWKCEELIIFTSMLLADILFDAVIFLNNTSLLITA